MIICLDEQFKYKNLFTQLNDNFILWQLRKPSGEIDEIYFGSKSQNIETRKYSVGQYCENIKEVSFKLNSENTSSSIYVLFGQEENKISRDFNDSSVISTKLQLDPLICACSKYKIELIDDNASQATINDSTVVFWGPNQGHYRKLTAYLRSPRETISFGIKGN